MARSAFVACQHTRRIRYGIVHSPGRKRLGRGKGGGAVGCSCPPMPHYACHFGDFASLPGPQAATRLYSSKVTDRRSLQPFTFQPVTLGLCHRTRRACAKRCQHTTPGTSWHDLSLPVCQSGANHGKVTHAATGGPASRGFWRKALATGRISVFVPPVLEQPTGGIVSQQHSRDVVCRFGSTLRRLPQVIASCLDLAAHLKQWRRVRSFRASSRSGLLRLPQDREHVFQEPFQRRLLGCRTAVGVVSISCWPLHFPELFILN